MAASHLNLYLYFVLFGCGRIFVHSFFFIVKRINIYKMKRINRAHFTIQFFVVVYSPHMLESNQKYFPYNITLSHCLSSCVTRRGATFPSKARHFKTQNTNKCKYNLGESSSHGLSITNKLSEKLKELSRLAIIRYEVSREEIFSAWYQFV